MLQRLSNRVLEYIAAPYYLRANKNGHMPGAIAKFKQLEKGQKQLAFLCKGNICRSPYAALFLKRQLGKASDIIITSGGLDTSPGKPANPQAQSIAIKRGIDMSAHKTSTSDQICSLVDLPDLVFVMEPFHLLVLLAKHPRLFKRAFTLGSLGYKKYQRLNIPDPYGKSDELFDQCFDQIEHALEQFITHLNE